MAYDYVPVVRDRLFLLPPDMREWLPEDHIAWFIIDAVEKIDTSALHKRHPNDGVGRRAYDPDMMLALLLYAYCTKTRSSRAIERLCKSDVAYRVVSADVQPDHSTIAQFRKDFEDYAKTLFVEVLRLAQEAGVGSVGVVALDGTKMAANASLKRNRTKEQLEKEVDAMFDEAEAADAGEDERFGDRRGDELPPELAKRKTRKEAIDKALKSLEERKKKEATPRQKRELDNRIQSSRRREFRSLQRLRKAKRRERDARKRNEQRVAAGLKPVGKPRRPGNVVEPYYVKQERSDYEANKARRKDFEKRTGREGTDDPKANLTDPDSRIMQTAQGAWTQAYNAQAAVNESGIIVGALVCNDPNDYSQFVPVVEDVIASMKASQSNEDIGTVIADAGYESEDNLNAAGPDRLIANGKAWKMKRELLAESPLSNEPTPVERNDHRLRTEEGRALYAKRQHMIEPVFGHTKENKAFRRFLQRGINAVNAEWDLMMTAHNLEKLYRKAH
jgi:transposase